MPSRSRPFAAALASLLALALSSFAGCTGEPTSAPISPEPAPRTENQGVPANAFPFELASLGFKMAIAVPEDGLLCIIVPASAQDPTACLGIDPGAMIEALPTGPDRPFGVAYARMRDWSYIVMLTRLGTGIESKEDIEGFIGGAAKPDPDAPGVTPKIIGPTPDQKYEIVRVGDVPVVKFRLEAGVPKDDPSHDVSAMIHYAAFGGKTAMVSFITSPKDVDKVMPYADASIKTLALPPRDAPERFGKPRAELETGGMRSALTILGPLVAVGALVFLWLARGKKAEGEGAGAPARPRARDAEARAKREGDEKDEEEG